MLKIKACYLRVCGQETSKRYLTTLLTLGEHIFLSTSAAKALPYLHNASRLALTHDTSTMDAANLSSFSKVHGDILNLLALVYSSLSKHDVAYSTLQLLEKLSLQRNAPPEVLAAVYNTMGTCLSTMKQWDEAVIYFEKALALFTDAAPKEYVRNLSIATSYTSASATITAHEQLLQRTDDSEEQLQILEFIFSVQSQEQLWDEAHKTMQSLFSFVAEHYGANSRQYANLLRKKGMFLLSIEPPEEAELLLQQAFDLLAQIKGTDDDHLLLLAQTLNDMISCQLMLGKWNQVSQYYKKLRTLYEQHPTLLYIGHVLHAFRAQMTVKSYYGEYEAVRALGAQALALELDPYPEGSIVTLAQVYFLAAFAHAELEADSTAVQLYAQGLALLDEQLEMDAVVPLDIINNQANNLLSRGQEQEAAVLYKQAISLAQAAFGKQHARYAQSLVWQASFFLQQGMFDAAQLLLLDARAILHKLPKDVVTVTIFTECLAQYAQLPENLRPDEDKSTLLRMIIALADKHLDPQINATYSAYTTELAQLLYAEGRGAEAEVLLKALLQKAESEFTREHLFYRNALYHLGLLLENLGKGTESRPLLEAFLELTEGVSHSLSRIFAAESLARIYREHEEFEAANAVLEQAITVAVHEFGADDALSLQLFSQQAVLFRDMERFDDAELLYEQLLPLLENKYQHNDNSYAMGLYHYSILLARLERFEEAEDYSRRSLRIAKDIFGESHANYAYALQNLGHILIQTEQREEADRAYRTALHIFENTMGPAHPDTQNLRDILDDTPQKLLQ